MAIEIVDLPIKMVIFHSYVSLPEGSLLEGSLPEGNLRWSLALGHFRTTPWVSTTTSRARVASPSSFC